MIKFLREPGIFHVALFGVTIVANMAIPSTLGLIPGFESWGQGAVELAIGYSRMLFLLVATLTVLPTMKTSPPNGLSYRWLPCAWILAGVGIGLLSVATSDGTAFWEAFYLHSLTAQVLFLVMTVVFGPICEELFFRKLMIDPFPDDLNLASVSSAFCFVAVHGRFAWSHIIAAGVFVLAYRSTGKIWVPIAAHAVSNGLIRLKGAQLVNYCVVC